MIVQNWVRGPVGLGAERRVTRAGCRKVLAAIPHMTAGTRLADVLPLLEADHRVQIVFTVPEGHSTWPGTDDYARSLGGLVLPWAQATQTEFDLVLAASASGVDQVHGPVLLLPHGVSNLTSRMLVRAAGEQAEAVHGLDRQVLTRDGRVVASRLVLTHDDELEVLRSSCPEALPAALVAGDVCLDRLMASLPFRDLYRTALGVRRDQRLVMVSSTWRSTSAFGSSHDLCERLLDELPERTHAVALVLHPNTWAVHGPRQVRSWLSDCIRRGLLVIPPEEGWRAVAVAADVVVGDHGSTTQYAAAVGTPVVLATRADPPTGVRSPVSVLARTSPVLRPDEPLTAQLHGARPAATGFAATISSRPGRAGRLVRSAAYALLSLAEPARAVPISPVPLPRPLVIDPEVPDVPR
jgi:hypothetical protein